MSFTENTREKHSFKEKIAFAGLFALCLVGLPFLMIYGLAEQVITR